MTAENIKKNFIWNTAGNLINFACQWLFMILVIRLSAEGTRLENSGLLNTAITATGVFLSIASYGMYSFQVSDTAQKHAQSVYVKSRIFTCSVSMLLCVIFLIIAQTWARPYSGTQSLCIFLFALYRMAESITDVFNSMEHKQGRLDIAGKTYALRGIVSLAVFVCVLKLTNSTVLTIGFMVVANVLIFVWVTLPKARPFYTKTEAPLALCVPLLIECLPLAAYAFLNTATASIPKLFLERVIGTTAIGIYNPVTAPVLLLSTCAAYLFIPFINTFANSWAVRNRATFIRSVASILGIVLLLLPVGLLVAKYLGAWGLRVCVGAGMEQYQYLLIPMVFAAILTSLVSFFSMVLTVMRCMKGLIIANVAGILTALFVSMPMMRRWDMQGTTYASILALSVQAIVLLIFMVGRIRFHFPENNNEEV